MLCTMQRHTPISFIIILLVSLLMLLLLLRVPTRRLLL